MSLLFKSKLKNAFWIIIPFLAFFFLFPRLSGADYPLSVVAAPVEFVSADSPQQTEVPQKPVVLRMQGTYPAPKFSAKSVLIYDPESNADLYTENVNAQLPIASLTKLMTALVAMQSPNFDRPIKLTKADQLNIAPYLHLTAGDIVRPADLVKAMLVGSANDAALTLANHFPNSTDFIAAMNQKAQELGMVHTHYTTPIGFDTPGNYSTAADLKILVNYALVNFPYPEIWQNKNYYFVSMTGKEYFILNSNSLVYQHPEIFSIKTGNTVEALGSMIVLAKDAPSGRTVITLVLDSDQREADTLTAVNYGFKGFLPANN